MFFIWTYTLNISYTFLYKKTFIIFCSDIFQNQILSSDQGFGREKDGNLCKFIVSNVVIFCFKEFERFELFKSVSQSIATFIVYYRPIENVLVKISFS